MFNTNKFAESIAYKKNGTTVAITALVNRLPAKTKQNEYGKFRVESVEAEVQVADVSNPAVSKKDFLVIDERIWAVTEVTNRIGCHLVRGEIVSRIDAQTATRATTRLER